MAVTPDSRYSLQKEHKFVIIETCPSGDDVVSYHHMSHTYCTVSMMHELTYKHYHILPSHLYGDAYFMFSQVQIRLNLIFLWTELHMT